MAKAKFFVQIEPEFNPHNWMNDDKGRPRVDGAVARRVTQRRPTDPLPGVVVVELTVNIPDEAFLPLAPAAVIDIPIEHTDPVVAQTVPIERVPEGS